MTPLLVWLELARAHSALGAALAVWVGGRVAGATWSLWWLPPMAVAFLLSAAGNAFNDAHDEAIDRINRPTRPLPRGAASAREARRLAYGSSALALLLALPFGLGSALGTLLGVGLLFAYTLHLRAIPLLGNAVVGLLAGMALGYGGLLAGNVPAILLPAASLTLFFAGREVLKTLHDMPGDQANGLSTLATVAGARRTLLVATLGFGSALLLLAGWVAAHPRGWPVLALSTLLSTLILAPLWLTPEPARRSGWALRCSKALGLLLLLGLSVI